MLRNPGGVVYGTITVGALLAAESAQRETYAETAGAILIALLAYWLAHAYSELTQQRLEHRQPITRAGVAHALAEGLTIIAGAAIPLLALLVCWVAGAQLTSAVTVALWTSAAIIVIVEVIAGLRAHLAARALMAQTAVGVVFGLLVIVLKLILQ